VTNWNSQVPNPTSQIPTTRSVTLALAVAVPVALATAAIVTFSAMELGGGTPLSYGALRNVAEAAALGHASEVLRLMAAGQDPNRVWTVRTDMISSTVTRVTALEAAIWSRRVQLIELLDRQGAIVGEDSRRHLACLAGDLATPVEDIVEYLSPRDAALNCDRGEALARVVERNESE
jgi:hypothetical protein